MKTKSIFKPVKRDNTVEKISELIEGHPVLGWVDGIGRLLNDTVEYAELLELLMENGSQIPCNLIMKIVTLTGGPDIDEVGEDYHRPDFDKWYRETYGQTVQDVEREKNKLYDKDFARMVRAEKHAQVAR